MKDIDLSSMISLTQEVFEIFKKDYMVFLSREKKDLLLNLDFSHFYKVLEKNDFPFIYFFGDTYYLNLDLDNQKQSLNSDLSNLYTNYLRINNINDIFQDLVLFMCFSLFCGEMNPLKLGLIEFEIRKIHSKYGIRTSNINNYKELEVGEVLLDGLLKDVPFNIIFLDTDSEIVNYLVEEKGSKVAIFYHEISELMKSKYRGFLDKKWNLNDYIAFYNTIDYQDVLDLIYHFISEKVR